MKNSCNSFTNFSHNTAAVARFFLKSCVFPLVWKFSLTFPPQSPNHLNNSWKAKQGSETAERTICFNVPLSAPCLIQQPHAFLDNYLLKQVELCKQSGTNSTVRHVNLENVCVKGDKMEWRCVKGMDRLQCLSCLSPSPSWLPVDPVWQESRAQPVCSLEHWETCIPRLVPIYFQRQCHDCGVCFTGNNGSAQLDLVAT